MKKYIVTLLLLFSALIPAAAQLSQPVGEVKLTPFTYNNISILIPEGCTPRVSDKEAVVKQPDSSFGLSLKIEKDKSATPALAEKLCRGMIQDLDVKEYSLTRVLIHGMSGARLSGKVEGTPVDVVILDGGKCLVKLVIIALPDHHIPVNRIIDSITRLSPTPN